MNKEAKEPLKYAGTGPAYSYVSTLNPFSGITGGGDRFPKWWSDAFPGNPDVAHITFKLGAIGLLTAGLVGSARMVQHFNRMSEMAERDNPAGKLHSQLSTTFDAPLKPKTQPKSAAIEIPKAPERGVEFTPPSWSMMNAVSMAAPLGVMLLAAGAGYKAADSIAGARRNRLLSDTIARKSDAAKALMQIRAKIPKGRATAKDIDKAHKEISSEDIFFKQAATPLTQKVVSAAGLLGIAMMSATAVGAHKYFSASNPNNIKYKALQKGLKEYAKQRTSMAPITTLPTDADDFFKSIDGPTTTVPKQVSPRRLPEFNPDTLNNPISVSL